MELSRRRFEHYLLLFFAEKYFVGWAIMLIFAENGFMMKRLLVYTFVSTMLLAMPIAASAAEPEMLLEEQIDADRISISVNQSTLHVTGASGLVLEVVSLTGKPVASIKIESPSQRVELNLPKGCYILKVGKVVRKVSIR